MKYGREGKRIAGRVRTCVRTARRQRREEDEGGRDTGYFWNNKTNNKASTPSRGRTGRVKQRR